jgi:RES domain-containing protein
MGEPIARVRVSGTWVRHVPAGGGALTTRRRGTEGRFHRPGEIALYLADGPETAWAEWYRALAERAQAPSDDVPRDLHRISVSLDQVVDLSTAAARTRAGLPTRMRPAASQWRAFQELAATMRAEGAQAVLYSSAARTRAVCLCVFEAGLDGLRQEGQPLAVIAPPAPPRGLRT